MRNPFEVVKQQMQVGMHSSTRSAVATIMKVDGLRGFYAGYGATVIREAPFDAIQFLVSVWPLCNVDASTVPDCLATATTDLRRVEATMVH